MLATLQGIKSQREEWNRGPSHRSLIVGKKAEKPEPYPQWEAFSTCPSPPSIPFQVDHPSSKGGVPVPGALCWPQNARLIGARFCTRICLPIISRKQSLMKRNAWSTKIQTVISEVGVWQTHTLESKITYRAACRVEIQSSQLLWFKLLRYSK